MRTIRLSGLKQWLKRSVILRPVVSKLRVLYRELFFIREIVGSGRLFVYQRNLISSPQLKSQKVITYALAAPPLRDFHDLIAWLGQASISYQVGGFCIYVPPQEPAQRVFQGVLSAYPSDSGLKILKDLRAPDQAVYCSTDVNAASPRLSDWIGYRPADYLRVANYLFDQGLAPRVYDLIEFQTPYNRLTSYVVQHVAGTAPSEEECTAFLGHLGRLCEDQLVPMQAEWRKAMDFLPPDCGGNLIRDQVTGKALYVDFQGFMLRDARKHISHVAHQAREHLHFGNPHWVRGGKYLYQSIPGLCIGKRDINTRWNLFREALQRQGVSVEGSVVLDVGCNAGMILYSALTDGAAWAVGWDRPQVAAAARKLLLSLGVTRFDIYGEDISSEQAFLLPLPHTVGLGTDSILFYLSMRKHIGFPDCVRRLPFKYMVYEDHYGVGLSEVKSYLDEITHPWNLRIDELASYRDGDGAEEHVVAILHRERAATCSEGGRPIDWQASQVLVPAGGLK